MRGHFEAEIFDVTDLESEPEADAACHIAWGLIFLRRCGSCFGPLRVLLSGSSPLQLMFLAVCVGRWLGSVSKKPRGLHLEAGLFDMG